MTDTSQFTSGATENSETKHAANSWRRYRNRGPRVSRKPPQFLPELGTSLGARRIRDRIESACSMLDAGTTLPAVIFSSATSVKPRRW